MNYRIPFIFASQIRKFTSFQTLCQQKNHYDSLGLKKSATQADIKGAYYKLSKVYHPDKNQGHTEDLRDQHAQKFRDITEAYEVLGNVKTRRLYDKGFSIQSPDHPTPSTEDPLHRFYKSREVRSKPPTGDGRQPIYDFDEWSKKHYGDSVKRDQEVKQRRAFYAKQEETFKEMQVHENLIYGLLGITLFVLLVRALYYSNLFRAMVGLPQRKMTVDGK